MVGASAAPAASTREPALSPFEPGVLGRGLEAPEATEAVAEAEPEPVAEIEAETEAAAEAMALQPRRRAPSVLADPVEVDRITARFQHLCRLVVRSRRPYCPINGILFLIPFAATETAGDADDVGAICQRDRAVAREVLQVHCPAFAMICDAETIPGFSTFLGRFPDEQREKVLGLDYPLVPVLDESAYAAMIYDGVRWVDQVLIPTLVYRLWRIESPDRKDAPALLAENIQLYQVLTQLHRRRDPLVRALTRKLATDSPGTALFGGCYLGATGRDASREQAFVVGVFRRLLENQNFITWTAEALTEDADYRRWAALGWSGIVFFLLMVVALGYFSWVR
jgi:type VI protein secretion system component VasK